jgi:hypothetical protein
MIKTESIENRDPKRDIPKYGGRILELNLGATKLADGTVVFLRDGKISKQPILSPSNESSYNSDR